jgi:hypothetical protein
MVGCSSSERLPGGWDRDVVVWVNAVAVANPDYRVIHESQGEYRRVHDQSISFLIEPRWPAPAPSKEFGRHLLTLGLSPEEGLQNPLLRPWHLTGILNSVDGQNGETRDVGEAASLLKSLENAEVRTSVVVELKEPLTEDEVKKIWPYQVDVALLSPAGPGGKSISWDYAGFCDSRGFKTCQMEGGSSLVGEFRHWVSMLRSGDGTGLFSLGLNLVDLQNSAQDGLYYGFILNAYPERVRRIIEDPRVWSVHVADVALASL